MLFIFSATGNPAKETQAIDRIYRIGQKRDVNVYLPILHHPEISSFEINLNRLVNRKSTLWISKQQPHVWIKERLELVSR